MKETSIPSFHPTQKIGPMTSFQNVIFVDFSANLLAHFLMASHTYIYFPDLITRFMFYTEN